MVDLVWLMGTSGVGKTTIGHSLAREFSARGVEAAFVDADQLRLAAGLPATEDEMVASGLRALMPVYGAAGARVVVVAGLVADRDQLERLLPVSRDRTFVCHLHATNDTLRERIARRGWLVELTESAVEYAGRLDSDMADHSIDTTGVTAAEVVDQLVREVWPLADNAGNAVERTSPPTRYSLAGARIVVLTGPGGVGASTVGFQLYAALSRRGDRVAYLDPHQLGFVGSAPGSEGLAKVRAVNASAIASNLACHGAETVVLSSDVTTIHALNEALLERGGRPQVFGLSADEQTLTERLRLRAAGGGPPIAGDDRLGVDDADLERATDRSVAETQCLNTLPDEARVLCTNGKDPTDVVAAVLADLDCHWYGSGSTATDTTEHRLSR